MLALSLLNRSLTIAAAVVAAFRSMPAGASTVCCLCGRGEPCWTMADRSPSIAALHWPCCCCADSWGLGSLGVVSITPPRDIRRGLGCARRVVALGEAAAMPFRLKGHWPPWSPVEPTGICLRLEAASFQRRAARSPKANDSQEWRGTSCWLSSRDERVPLGAGSKL